MAVLLFNYKILVCLMIINNILIKLSFKQYEWYLLGAEPDPGQPCPGSVAWVFFYLCILLRSINITLY
jgi:hypothetical protein